jgi:hypothetical protein
MFAQPARKKGGDWMRCQREPGCKFTVDKDLAGEQFASKFPKAVHRNRQDDEIGVSDELVRRHRVSAFGRPHR